MTTNEKFHGDIGRFLTAKDARSRTDRYKKHKHDQGLKPDTFTRSEFFGINRINKLLAHKECVGIRVYYGKTYEDQNENPVAEGKGELKSRMLLVGVRADGSDIFGDPTGLKDPGDDDTVGDGWTCPRHC